MLAYLHMVIWFASESRIIVDDSFAASAANKIVYEDGIFERIL
jgi:hypothetical protein